MTRLILMALMLAITGCGRTNPAPSVLQRYDRLAFDLRQVTVQSDRVAEDVSVLRVELARSETGRIVSTARTLSVDCSRLLTRAGRDATTIRSLLALERSGTFRNYLSLVVQSLNDDGRESAALRSLAAGLRFDPLMARGNDAAHFTALARTAREYSIAASDLTRRAIALRRRLPGHFLYVRVGPETPIGSRGAA